MSLEKDPGLLQVVCRGQPGWPASQASQIYLFFIIIINIGCQDGCSWTGPANGFTKRKKQKPALWDSSWHQKTKKQKASIVFSSWHQFSTEDCPVGCTGPKGPCFTAAPAEAVRTSTTACWTLIQIGSDGERYPTPTALTNFQGFGSILN